MNLKEIIEWIEKEEKKAWEINKQNNVDSEFAAWYEGHAVAFNLVKTKLKKRNK